MEIVLSRLNNATIFRVLHGFVSFKVGRLPFIDFFDGLCIAVGPLGHTALECVVPLGQVALVLCVLYRGICPP